MRSLSREIWARTHARPYSQHFDRRCFTHIPYAHRKVTQLRNERNTNLAFPCFYVIPGSWATLLSHLVQFHRVVLVIAMSVLYKRASPTIKTQNRIRTVRKQHSTHSRRREFSQSNRSIKTDRAEDAFPHYCCEWFIYILFSCYS